MQSDFLKYIKIRFPPLFFIPIIFIFYLSFYLYSEMINENIVISLNVFIGFLVVFLMFFHIRLLDDIKDYKKSDFYKKDSLKKYLIISVLLELILSAVLGLNVLICYLILLLFSIGIFYDFFIKKLLTKNILINNFTHQLMIIFIGIFIFIVNHKNILKINCYYLIFCFIMFLVFSLFDFSRKIKNKNKEDYKKSYNYTFGKKNFSILILGVSSLIWFLMIFSFFKLNYMIVLFFESIIFLTLVFSIFLYLKDKIKEDSLKKISFLYLFLTLIIIIFSSLFMKNIFFRFGLLVVI